MQRLLPNLLPYTLRFFLPWACAGCRAALTSLEDDGFCGKCWLHLPRIQGLICRLCGLPLKEGGQFCFSCRQSPPGILIRAATEFNGIIRPGMHRFKYAGRKSLARAFGTLMHYAWSRYREIQDVQAIVPVPLYKSHEKARGFNQAELLAEALGHQIGKPVLSLLTRVRETPSQVDLSRVDRQANVRAAFALEPLSSASLQRLKGMSFLLVDDVCTTASTLRECAIVLRQAGAAPPKALVLARDL